MLRTSTRVYPSDLTSTRVDHEILAIGDCHVAQERMRRRLCLGDIQRDLELVPGGLLVGEVDGPGDRGVRLGKLGDDLALGIQSVHAKPHRLALESPGGIAVEPRRLGRWIHDLRRQKIFVSAVAQPCHPDRRMNRRPDDRVVLRLGRGDSPSGSRPTAGRGHWVSC